MMNMTFPIVTEDHFPHGLRCDGCHRIIEVGQPYAERLDGIADGGVTLSTLTCVYYPDCKKDN